MRAAWVILSLLLLLPSSSSTIGQEPACVYPRMDQVDARLRARVIQSADRFQYHYMIRNGPGATQLLEAFAIEAFAKSAQDVAQVRPADWRTARIVRSSFYEWTVLGSGRGLPAGASAAGFGVADADLPAIARFLAWGEVEPPKFAEGQAPDFCENSNILENAFKGVTVGPRPARQEFVPLEFVNYLITLVHDSRKQNWIQGDGVYKSLLAKLINAKRSLESGQISASRNLLAAFLQEVRAVSCQDFSCPGNRPLTSEAYALLFFNGQYLLERLR